MRKDPQPSAEVPSQHTIGKIAFASAIGATIEWYDFFLYGVVAGLVFNKLFFPAFDPVVGTILAYATFAVGFIARPLGGIIFGHYGDRIGRKTVLILTLLIMGVSTFLIGFLPTYGSIGIWAPILLLLLRVFQGIGIGGEWGGAVLMAFEHAPEGKRGFYASWPQIGVPAGLLLSAGVVALLSYISDAHFLLWGWRVAFLISAALVVVGLYIRLKIMETPDFARMMKEGGAAKIPFFELFRTSTRGVVLGCAARYIEGVTFNLLGVFIITYATTALHLPRQMALLGVIIASAINLVAVPLCGLLSDRIGRRTLYGVGAAGMAVLVFPAFWLMTAHPQPVWVWLAIIVPFCTAYPALYGTQAALFSELFAPRVRYSGISFCYQFSGIFASGLTPLIATALLAWNGGQPWLICLYTVIAAIISLVAVIAMRPAAAVSPAPAASTRLARA